MIFVDTSGFVAAFDAADSEHCRVAKAWRTLAAGKQKMLTTHLVFAETVTYLRRRAGWKTSRAVGEAILQSPSIEVLGLDGELLESAWREFLRSGDPTLSLCDAASFVVMRLHGVSEALTLDRHFVEAGFEGLP